MRGGTALNKMRSICLALPETQETMTWGNPHFRVKDKIFAGYSEKGDKRSIGFKLEMDHALELISLDERFTKSAYVGKHGWVSVDANAVDDWHYIETLVHESFRLIAPKRVLAQLGDPSATATQPTPAAKKAKKKAQKKAQKKTASKGSKKAASKKAAKKVGKKKAAAKKVAKKSSSKKAATKTVAKKKVAKKKTAVRASTPTSNEPASRSAQKVASKRATPRKQMAIKKVPRKKFVRKKTAKKR